MQNKITFGFYIAIILILVWLWNTGYGQIYLYPFTILATYFHEMGHGLAAMLVGADFNYLMIYPDGSGVAVHSSLDGVGRFGSALIAISGPLGPTIFGFFLIYFSKSQNASKWLLVSLGAFIIITTVIWVRSFFGAIFLIVVGIILILFGSIRNEKFKEKLSQFIGITAMLSLYQNVDYLFTEITMTNDGKFIFSDTGYLEEYLFLPHWFWAILIIAISLTLGFISFKHIFENKEMV